MISKRTGDRSYSSYDKIKFFCAFCKVYFTIFLFNLGCIGSKAVVLLGSGCCAVIDFLYGLGELFTTHLCRPVVYRLKVVVRKNVEF